MNDLSPRARAALQSFGADQGLPPDRQQALLDRIETSIEAGEAEPGGRADALMADPDERPATPVWFWAVAAAAAAVLVLWAFDTVAVGTADPEPSTHPAVAPYQAERERPEGQSRPVQPARVPDRVPESVPAPAPAPAPESVHRSGPAEAGTSGPAPAPAPSTKPRRTTLPRKPTPTPPIAKQTTLGAEIALLREARTALDGGNPSAAMKQLKQHAKRYPEGQMVQDRRALRIVALCELGRVGQARTEASAFRGDFPRSHYHKRIESCLHKDPPAGDGSD